MAEPYVLEVEDLIKTYPKFLLDKVSFALPLGRVMGFVGQNGAGKTTTLKALMGNIHPDSGEARSSEPCFSLTRSGDFLS